MKKVFCTSFLLFATTLCFSAPTGKTDTLPTANNQGFDLISLPTVKGDMPIPNPHCSWPPDDCPQNQ